MQKLLRLLFIVSLILVAASAAQAQGFRIGDSQSVSSSLTIPGVISTVASSTINICASPANAVPCTNKATTYTSVTLGTPCSTSTQVVLAGTSSCVATTDTRGNWGAWIASGNYDWTVTLSTGQSFGPFSISAGNPSATNLVGPGTVTGNYTHSGTETFTGEIKCTIVNRIPCVSNSNPQGWAGADGGAWIASAITSLPATGGTVDARGLEGAQNLTAFTIAKPVVLLMGTGPYTFLTNPGITINVEQFHLQGLGKGITTLIPANAVGGAILDQHTFSPGRVVIQDLTIDGTGLANPDYGLKIDSASLQGYDVQRVKILGFAKAGAAALNIARANSGTFIDNDFMQSTIGVSFTGGPGVTNLNNFYGGQILGNGTQILSTGGDANHFFGINIASGTASPAVWIKAGFANVFDSNWFENNTVGASTSSIRLGDSGGGTFAQANVIRSNEYTDTTTWFVQIQNGAGNKIEDNFDGNGAETAFVRAEAGAARTVVTNNHSNGALLSDASAASDTFFMGPNSDISKTVNGYNILGLLVGKGISTAAPPSGNTGFQHKRVAGCATAGALPSTCDTTVTWTSAFADANYTATCTGAAITSGLPEIVGHSISAAKTGAAITVRTTNNSAAAAQFTNIECIAVHD